MNVQPTKLERSGDAELLIEWSDGQRRCYRVAELREQCPCATCREKHTAVEAKPTTDLPVISLSEAQPLRITGMKPVGNYAYSIEFSDGHNTGIYTLDLLLTLGEQRD